MSDASKPAGPEDMLPVGMMGNVDAGSPGAHALEAIAIRKHGVPGWEPFHYEKISATDYEVTGGVALVLAGGLKKWPEPHTSVIVSATEIIAALNLRPAVAETAPAAEPLALPPAPASVLGISSPAAPRYLTVVLQLPQDKEGRLRIIDAFSPGQQFFGALVEATAMENEIAVTRSLAQHCSAEELANARQGAR